MVRDMAGGGRGRELNRLFLPLSAAPEAAESRSFVAEGILSAGVRLSRTKADDLSHLQTRIE